MRNPNRLRFVALLVALGLLASACGLFGDDEHTELVAYMENVNNLFEGSEVRVLGLKVGNVTAIIPTGDVVRVEMRVDGDRELPADVQAHLLPTSLLGERFVQLDPPYTGGAAFPDGGEIPLERTTIPVDIDDVLHSFENFLRSLDRDVLADLIDALADTFAGQGEGLNELIAEGSESVRVLADSSEDLNALVVEFASLNETLATRDDVIGRTMDRFSVVLQTLIGEREQIIESIINLRRLTVELRPLLDDHTDPLIQDLEQLATTLSTVERNLDRVGDMIRGSRMLFEGAGRAVEWEEARIALNNQAGMLGEAIALRLSTRLTGLCLRLGVEECSTPDFFDPIIWGLLCTEGPNCPEQQAIVSDVLVEALRVMPPEVTDTLVEEARQREAEAEAERSGPETAPEQGTAPEAADDEDDDRPLVPTLPLPDPRLQQQDAPEVGLLQRLLGGAG
jgi:phospholipid/cholesterol/gamma-HCH transport system substrate-binding protein